MITKEQLKREIDHVQDKYLGVLYRIIQIFEDTPETGEQLPTDVSGTDKQDQEWLTFVKETYGCLADDPLERGEQGSYEVREVIR